MAVWMSVYGQNGLGNLDTTKVEEYLQVLNGVALDELKIMEDLLVKDSLPQYFYERATKSKAWYQSMGDAEYRAHLQSIGMPYTEIDELINSSVKSAELQHNERKRKFDEAYEAFQAGIAKSYWEVAYISEHNIRFVNNLNHRENQHGFQIGFFNDLVVITGPSKIFSHYADFEQGIPDASREYYHQYFSAILRAFESSYIFYTHEWHYIIDEDDDEFDSAKLLAAISSCTTQGTSIHDIRGCYLEQL